MVLNNGNGPPMQFKSPNLAVHGQIAASKFYSYVIAISISVADDRLVVPCMVCFMCQLEHSYDYSIIMSQFITITGVQWLKNHFINSR